MQANSVLIRGGLLCGSMLLLWLALPGNFSFWPLLPISLVPYFFLLSTNSSVSESFLYGLLGGIFFNFLQLYWIVLVLNQYGGLNWYLAVPAAFLLAVYMSFYLGLFSAGFHLLGRNGGFLLLPVAAAALWVGLDWVRSWFFSGFPWMDIGYGLWSQPRLLQIADLVGHAGLTFLIVLINGTLYFSLRRRHKTGQRVAALVLLLCVCLLSGWYSTIRWQQVTNLIEESPAASVGVVQGNVEQTRKWSPEERLRTINDYVRLSSSVARDRNLSLIVWPETALPFYPSRDDLMRPLTKFVSANGTVLISGAPWFEVEQDRSKRVVHHYNGALLMQSSGDFEFGYYKTHLVPYGEYVPLKRFMPFLAPLVEAAGDFSPGTITTPLSAGPIRAGVLICFESIFPDLGRAWVEAGANLLLNLTNDAWYGKSSAPYQSWSMTVYRSVETRRSMARSANTGISGFIDPLGRVMSQSGLFIDWAEAAEVPLLEEKTFFVRGGYLFAPICGAVACMIIVSTLLSKKRGRKRLR